MVPAHRTQDCPVHEPRSDPEWIETGARRGNLGDGLAVDARGHVDQLAGGPHPRVGVGNRAEDPGLVLVWPHQVVGLGAVLGDGVPYERPPAAGVGGELAGVQVGRAALTLARRHPLLGDRGVQVQALVFETPATALGPARFKGKSLRSFQVHRVLRGSSAGDQ